MWANCADIVVIWLSVGTGVLLEYIDRTLACHEPVQVLV